MGVGVQTHKAQVEHMISQSIIYEIPVTEDTFMYNQ